MDRTFGTLLEHYEALVSEYRADLERNLDLAVSSASDPFAALDKINRVLMSEIARLKVQLIDLDLKVAQMPGGAVHTGFKPMLDGLRNVMPVYGAKDFISIGAGVATHGFHFTEIADGGFIHRWAGPATRSGFTALIDRSRPLVGEIPLVKFIDKRIYLADVSIDGEAAKFKYSPEAGLRFVIAPIPGMLEPAPTLISFHASETLMISEVQPQFKDPRRVSFNIPGVALYEYSDELWEMGSRALAAQKAAIKQDVPEKAEA